MIRDNNSKERNVNIAYYCSKEFIVLVACELPMDIPLASMIILSTGEVRAAMRDPDFRNNKDMTNVLIEAQRYALKNKMLVPTEGGIFSIIHPDHGSNKKMPEMGAQLQQVVVSGSLWNRWFVPVERVLDGVI